MKKRWITNQLQHLNGKIPFQYRTKTERALTFFFSLSLQHFYTFMKKSKFRIYLLEHFKLHTGFKPWDLFPVTLRLISYDLGGLGSPVVAKDLFGTVTQYDHWLFPKTNADLIFSFEYFQFIYTLLNVLAELPLKE